MLFFNKTKATWKKAYQLRETMYFKELVKLTDILKKTDKALVNFKTKFYVQWKAYLLAEANGFHGSPEFYWIQAEKTRDTLITDIEHNREIIADSVVHTRCFIRKYL
jgi:hypothetical protein